MEERCELLKQMGTEDIGSIAEAARSTAAFSTAASSLKHNIADSTMTWSPNHNSNRNNPESHLQQVN